MVRIGGEGKVSGNLNPLPSFINCIFPRFSFLSSSPAPPGGSCHWHLLRLLLTACHLSHLIGYGAIWVLLSWERWTWFFSCKIYIDYYACNIPVNIGAFDAENLVAVDTSHLVSCCLHSLQHPNCCRILCSAYHDRCCASCIYNCTRAANTHKSWRMTFVVPFPYHLPDYNLMDGREGGRSTKMCETQHQPPQETKHSPGPQGFGRWSFPMT